MIDNKKRFYVYIYLNPLEKRSFTCCDKVLEYQPFYVGKGCRDRDLKHYKEAIRIIRLNELYDTRNRKINKIINIINKGFNPMIIKIKENLLEDEAYKLEIELVDYFGIKDEGGILCNYESGGRGGYTVSEESRKKMSNSALGRVVSEETRLKLSIAKKGCKNPRTEEWTKNQRTSLLKSYQSGEIEPWNKGKTGIYKASEEAKKKQSVAMKGRKNTPEHCENIALAMKEGFRNGTRKVQERLLNQFGENNYMFGKIPKWSKGVVELNNEGNVLQEFQSIKEACKELILSRHIIKRICEMRNGYKKNDLILRYN